MHMTTRQQRGLRMIMFAASAGIVVSCGGSARDTLPAGWAGAAPLTVQQSTCNGDIMSAKPSLDVTDTGGTISVTYGDAEFRCNQQVCAYVMDAGATTRVLVEPCDLHPTSVTRCDCLYDVTFTLPTRASRTAVELYRRGDFYAATSPPLPTLVASRAVGSAALTWYKTCGAPVCMVVDAGAATGDGGVAGCTTEKVGDTCATNGATCDPGEGCSVLLRCTDKDPRVQQGGCPISRRSAKRDISYLDDAALGDLAARLRAVRLARYRYKDAPSQERLGFIIDDGKADLAVDQTLDQIDLYSYLSWTVAALQFQMNRADAQEHEILRLRQMLSRRKSSTSR